jgi:hypothetical protein
MGTLASDVNLSENINTIKRNTGSCHDTGTVDRKII